MIEARKSGTQETDPGNAGARSIPFWVKAAAGGVCLAELITGCASSSSSSPNSGAASCSITSMEDAMDHLEETFTMNISNQGAVSGITFNFGDGATTNTGNNTSTQHTYAKPGPYKVSGGFENGSVSGGGRQGSPGHVVTQYITCTSLGIEVTP